MSKDVLTDHLAHGQCEPYLLPNPGVQYRGVYRRDSIDEDRRSVKSVIEFLTALIRHLEKDCEPPCEYCEEGI